MDGIPEESQELHLTLWKFTENCFPTVWKFFHTDSVRIFQVACQSMKNSAKIDIMVSISQFLTKILNYQFLKSTHTIYWFTFETFNNKLENS